MFKICGNQKSNQKCGFAWRVQMSSDKTSASIFIQTMVFEKNAILAKHDGFWKWTVLDRDL